MKLWEKRLGLLLGFKMNKRLKSGRRRFRNSIQNLPPSTINAMIGAKAMN
jgi:hypothetical protein